MTSIAENVANVRRQIRQAALACGRDPERITLCAATKTNGPAAIQAAIAAGVDCCGEKPCTGNGAKNGGRRLSRRSPAFHWSLADK